MSAISLKSISGITSITTPAGVDDQLTLHNNNTTERVKIDVAGNVHVNNHLAVAGITTINGGKLAIGNVVPSKMLELYSGSTVASMYESAGASYVEQQFKNSSRHYILGIRPETSHAFCIMDNSSGSGGVLLKASGHTVTLDHDLNVDGHTNLDNVSISGVTTASQGLRVPNGSASTNYISVGDGGGLRFWGTSHQFADIRVGNLHFRNASLQNILELQQDKDIWMYGPIYVEDTARFTQTVTIADKIEHFGDTDTKIRFPAADTITAETSGNERFRIDSNGRIGLGIANPDAYFSSYNRVVMGRTNDTGGMTIVSSTTSGGYISFADGTSGNAAYRGMIAYQHSGDYMTFGTDGGNERLRINSNGNVQIGTAADPGNALRYVDIGNYNTGSSAGSILRLLTVKSDGSSSTSADIVKYKAGGLVINNNEAIGTTGYISFGTATGGGSITERLRIDSSGTLKLNQADSLIHTNSNSSRLRLFGGSNESVSNGAALTLHGVSHSSGNYADLAAATGGHIQFRVGTSERLRIESGGGIKIPVVGTTIPVGGILHHTNNNLYVRGGTSGLILGNQDNTTTVQVFNGYIKFETNDGSEKLRITSTGKVGINESSPQQMLHVHDDTNYQGILINGNGAPRIAFARSTTTTGEWSVGIDGTNGNQFVINNSNDNSNRKFIVSSSGVTAAGTITSGGNATFNGVVTFNGGYQQGNASAGLALFGSSAQSRGVVISHGVNDMRPTHTNAMDLGTSGQRWKQIYTNNSVNTSDKNLKHTISDSDLGLSFVNKLRPVSYKWVQKEEEDLDTKTHYGLIAQEIETALTSEGKTLNDFAGVFKPDDYKDDGTGGAMGISLGEIISPLIKAIQELSAEVAALKSS